MKRHVHLILSGSFELRLTPRGGGYLAILSQVPSPASKAAMQQRLRRPGQRPPPEETWRGLVRDWLALEAALKRHCIRLSPAQQRQLQNAL